MGFRFGALETLADVTRRKHTFFIPAFDALGYWQWDNEGEGLFVCEYQPLRYVFLGWVKKRRGNNLSESVLRN